jgi:hypothetical protein
MERGMKYGLFLLGILLAGFSLYAQESSLASTGEVSSDYRLDPDGKIRQRIAWTRSNAYFYEVEIEKIASGAVWELELKERTEQTFLEVSLPPGMYRYRILGYNVLGRVGAVSEWAGIRVFAAKQPAAVSFSPAAYFMDSPDREFTLTVTGSDLAEEALIHITAKKGGAPPVQPSSIRYSADENTIQAVFPAADLALGAYDIVITNPGGMTVTLGGFYTGFTHPVDINVSLGYGPVFPVYGYFFDTYSAVLYPLGFIGRVGVVPVKRLWGWIGFELNPWYTDLKTKNDTYTLTGTMLGASVSAVYQKWMRNYTMALNARLGAGAGGIANIEFSHKDGSRSENTGSGIFTIHTGVSLQWFVWKNLFIEGGAEYVQILSPPNPPSALIRALLSAGMRF